jgi:hypothetical protein
MTQIGSWEQYTPGSYANISIPAGTVSIQAECRGSGGAGRCGGGGGAGYARKTIPFVAGMTLSAVVADAAEYDHGWTSSISSSVAGIFCSAPGGGKCLDDEVTGGLGANASDCVGDIRFGGGRGGNFVGYTNPERGDGGGGGGSGRPVANGSQADGFYPGNYGGGKGGSNADRLSEMFPPDAGNEGGGGGGYFNAGNPAGGRRGGRGWVWIRFFDS